MATLYEDILGWSTNPGSSGDCFFEPYAIKAANDRWSPMVLVYNNGASPAEIFGRFRVPEAYVSAPCIHGNWTSTATTGSLVMRFTYRTVATTESFDQTGQTESASVVDSSPSAVNLRQDAIIELTAASLTAGDIVEYEYVRDPTDAADDLAAAVTFHGVYFGYQDA